MNQPEIKFDVPTSGTDGVGRKDELQSLRFLIAAALGLVIVFTVAVDYFISAQTSELRKVAYQEQRAEEETARRFNSISGRAADFWVKLVAFSKTHSDFAPVIDKWKNTIHVSTNSVPTKSK